MPNKADSIEVSTMGDALFVRVKLACAIIKEKEGMYTSHCPALELFSQGENEAEAQQNIEEAIRVFIETCLEMNTLAQVLRDVNFSKTARKTAKSREVKIPAFLPAALLPASLFARGVELGR